MELLKNLELITIVRDDEKAVLKFLDMDRGEIRPVNFNKKVYKNGSYVADDAKAEKVEKWCQDIFGLEFDDLEKAIGRKMDVYAYDNFNSLFEVDIVEKFTKEMNKKAFQTQIEEIGDDGNKLYVNYSIDGKKFQTKFQYSEYLDDMKIWVVDPLRKTKQLDKFEGLFDISFDDPKRDEVLIGKEILVQCNCAFGKFYYGEITLI